MEKPAATVLASETLYEGRIFTVHRDLVRLPKGHESRLEVVRHHGSVVLLPMPEPDRLILVRQYRYPIDLALWELAAGTLKPGEVPLDGAVRECEEETGLVPATAEHVGSFYPTPGYCDEQMHFFKLTGLAARSEGEPALPDEDEDLEVRTFSLDDLRRMLKLGEIQDLKTAVGITLV